MNLAPSLAGHGTRSSSARWIAPAIRARRAGAAFVLGLLLLEGAVAGAGLLLLVPLLGLAGLGGPVGDLGPLADAVLSVLRAAGVPATLLSVLAVFVLVAAAGALARRWREIASARLEAGVAADLRKGLFRSITGMEWIPFARLPSASLAFALTDGAGAAGTVVDLLLGLAAEAVLLAAYLALSLALSPAMTALCAALGALLFLAFHRWILRGRDQGQEAAGSLEALYRAVHEHLGGGRVTRGLGLEARARAEVEGLADRVAEGRVDMERGLADARAGFAVAAAATLAVLVLVARSVLGLGAGPILLLLFLFSRILPRLARIREMLHGLAAAEPQVRAAAALQARCDADAESGNGAAADASFAGGIRFEGVSLSYGGSRPRPALDRVDLAVRPGEGVAVVGPSGAGKSTLADLALGLIAPGEGRVLVDGEPLEGARRRAWRSRVGYVPQETFLFHDTVRANLLYARTDAREEDLREALRLAGASDLVARLPGGLDAVVGDRGGLLSGGERQRIALARALLRRPALLVLDEATGHLDPESEARILAALEGLRGSVTILMVTHRAAAARWMDRVVTLEEGRVVSDSRVHPAPGSAEAARPVPAEAAA